VDGIDWDRTVFALVAPDALVRHLGGDVVRRMQAEGFTPVGWKPLWRRPAALDAFNERNINQVWKSYLYRLVDRLFAFGPAIALLMRDDAPVAGPDRNVFVFRPEKTLCPDAIVFHQCRWPDAHLGQIPLCRWLVHRTYHPIAGFLFFTQT